VVTSWPSLSLVGRQEESNEKLVLRRHDNCQPEITEVEEDG